MEHGFTWYALLPEGVQHLIVSPEPMTPRTVELVSEAKQSLSS